MNCEESKNLITVSVYGKLTPSEKSQLEAHLRECSRCAKIFERTREVNDLFNEKEEIQLPDKEKSWQIIAAKAVKRKTGWLVQFIPKRPAFQYSLAFLLLIVGFAAGYFIHSGWQRSGEIAQLRQEVLQIREITAASLLRQESLNMSLREMSVSSRLGQPGEQPLAYLLRRLTGEAEINTRQIPTNDPYLLFSSPAARQNFFQSLSEQTSPLVEIALAFTRYIQQ